MSSIEGVKGEHQEPAEVAGDPPALTTTLHTTDHPPKLVVAGELTSTTVAQFENALHEAAVRLPRTIIDLTQLERLNSRAIGILFAERDRIAAVLAATGSSIAWALSRSNYPKLVLVPTSRPRGPAGRTDAVARTTNRSSE